MAIEFKLSNSFSLSTTLVQELTEDGYSFSIDTDSIPSSISINENLLIRLNQNKGTITLQSLVVVFQWAPILFKCCNFIELDASFRGTKLHI